MPMPTSPPDMLAPPQPEKVPAAANPAEHAPKGKITRHGEHHRRDSVFREEDMRRNGKGKTRPVKTKKSLLFFLPKSQTAPPPQNKPDTAGDGLTPKTATVSGRRPGSKAVAFMRGNTMLFYMNHTRVSLLLAVFPLLFLCSGCVLVPLLGDNDTSVVDRNLERDSAQRMERMRRNPNINETEYQIINQRTGNPSGLPPKATVEELEKRVEADKKR
jgi:hypothetical protein